MSLESQTYLGHNQEAYQDLRLALQLNLRRQLLIAVCDDAALQEQLAQRLEANFSPLPESVPVAPEVRARQRTLVTLRLSGDRPDPVREVVLWLKQQRRIQGRLPASPGFQILGIDQLTRQSPTVQNRFLASLVRVDALLTQLDCRLVVWVPRPWLNQIRQSVPGFWQSRSGLFEFVGEPTAAAVTPSPVPKMGSLENGDRPAKDIPAPTPAAQTVFSGVMPPVGATAAETLAALAQAAAVAPEPPPPDLAPPPDPKPADLQLPLDLPLDLAQDSDLADLWRYVQDLADRQAGPLTLGRAYLALGQRSRDRLTLEAPSTGGLDFATAVYHRAIAGLPEGGADWCDALNDLASLYWLRGQQPSTDAAPWLRRSIATYETALKAAQKDRLTADTLGRLSGNLATVYGLMANLEDDPTPWLEQAAAAYAQALAHSPAERSPTEYANLQNSLGAIHWRLAQGGSTAPQHLAQAITAYSEALRHYRADEAPQEYAMVQNNLGIAYWSLAQYQQPLFLLERAIAAYQAALQYRTLEVAPEGCAATANNLGTAHWDLAQLSAVTAERRIAALEAAIAAYETALTAAQIALQASPPPSLGFDLWATCHSAGVVHDQLAQALPNTQTDARQRHLATALEHYLLAYQGWRDRPAQMEVLTTALVYNTHLSFELFGIAGQQAVLSKLPGEVLAEVMRRL